MPETVNVKNIGLRGVSVADTKISFIDGEKGILIYRGYRIEELAEKSSFMEVAYLLLNGSLPTKEQAEWFEHQAMEAREMPRYIYESFSKWPKDAKPMDVLQASVPLLAMADPGLLDETREANVRKAIRLIARLPVLLAAWERTRQGLEPLSSDDSLSHAANFLWQLHGKRPGKGMAHDLDTCLILHADHTFNASTFACREVVSTRAHMYAGVTAGIGALSGSLHGGANARVMAMLEDFWLPRREGGRGTEVTTLPGFGIRDGHPWLGDKKIGCSGTDHGHGPCGLQGHRPSRQGSESHDVPISKKNRTGEFGPPFDPDRSFRP